MRFFIITLALVSINLDSLGQGKNALDLFRNTVLVADGYFSEMDYRGALHFYNKALEKNPNDQSTKLKTAECHLKLYDYQKAEEVLGELVAQDDTTVSILSKYALALHANGNLDKAAVYYAKILKLKPSPDIASKLEFINNLGYYRMEDSYEIANMPFNSEQADFSPQLLNGGLVFLSSRQKDIFIQHQPSSATNDNEGMLRYYYYLNGQVMPYEHGEKLKSSFHEGPLSFFQQSSKVAYTRNNLRDGVKSKTVDRVNLQIFFAELTSDNQWENRTAFQYNSEDYSVGHPTLNEAGDRMYFSSDMPGGYGGTDIYVSFKKENKWTTPENLGININSSESELFPRIVNDSVLYFATSGLGGFGRLDIFQVTKKGDAWGIPRNVGAPINSEADDFAILFDASGRNGFFSSNRPGGKGRDDIYSFSIKNRSLLGEVYQKQHPNLKLSDAEIMVYDEKQEKTLTLHSDSLGRFNLNLPFDKEFSLSASKTGHSSVFLQPIPTHFSDLSDTVAVGLYKNELFVKGRIYSNETQGLMKGVKVVLENLDVGTTDSLLTEDDGSYIFPLTPNQSYKVTAMTEGYLDAGFSVNTSNLYKGDLLNDILLEQVYVDKLVTFFDFDDYRLKSSYKTGLKQLLRTLKKFPESIITVTAHADARGTVAYNQQLSNRRLNAITAYLNANGIRKNRIHGTAFGEALLLNTCSDGVDCGEEDHSQNRRAELKVQMPED